MIEAFLFDLDGTLQDTEVLYVEAWRRAYGERGCDVSAEQSQAMVYGKASSDVFAAFHARFPAAYPTAASLNSSLRRHFLELKETREVRIPGSIELLARLSERWPVAIVSGNTRADVVEAIESLGIGPRLAFYLSCEDYAPGKPDPACYRLATARLCLPPQRCLVFEDSSAGVAAAKGAGMSCVALRRPGTPAQDLSAADRVLSDLANFCIDTGETTDLSAKGA